MLDAIKKVFNDLINHSFLLLFFLGVCAGLSTFAPDTLKQAILLVNSLLPNSISHYFYSMSVSYEQIEAFFFVLSLTMLSLVVLMLIFSKDYNKYYAIQGIFEKVTLLSLYFLLINYILSNYNLPSINLVLYLDSFSLGSIPPMFTLSCVFTYVLSTLTQTVNSIYKLHYADR